MKGNTKTTAPKGVVKITHLTFQNFKNGSGFSSRQLEESTHSSSGLVLKFSHFNPKQPQTDGHDYMFESMYDSVTWQAILQTFKQGGLFRVYFDDGTMEVFTREEFLALDSASIPGDYAYLQA